MDDPEIKSLVARLSRPHPSGGLVIERAAILANGGDFPAVMDWITAHAGAPDTTIAPTKNRGLHGSRLQSAPTSGPSKPSRYVLPAGAVD
jgi:hypothetical protein